MPSPSTAHRSPPASFWAQGGLAAALVPGDSLEHHAQDTINAGRGLCRTAAVEALAYEAPGAAEELIARGVGFDTDPDGNLALALEGGHSDRRIVHAGGSATGRPYRVASGAATASRVLGDDGADAPATTALRQTV